MNRISVIIPTKNRPADVRALLACLAMQTRLPHEVLVVDDSEGREAGPIVASDASQLPFPVCCLRPPGGSLTRARNAGVAKSRGELLVFLDDDILLQPDFLALLEDTLTACGSDYAGGCGATTPYPDFTPYCHEFNRFSWLFLHHNFWTGAQLANGMSTFSAVHDRVADICHVSGGVSIYRREVCEQHQFDERMNGYSAMEDVDFSTRVGREYRLFYNPRIVVYHRTEPDKGMTTCQYHYVFMRNYLYLFNKNMRPDVLGWTAMLWSIIGYFLLALRYRQLNRLRGYLAAIRDTFSQGWAPA